MNTTFILVQSFIKIPVQFLKVKGGLPGVDWGELYRRHINKITPEDFSYDPDIVGSDLELCVFVSHEKTGSSCAIYRSLEKKMISISFRGTCEPVDLVTDANIFQTPWVDGVDEDEQNVPRVHVGFRYVIHSLSILNAIKHERNESNQNDTYYLLYFRQKFT